MGIIYAYVMPHPPLAVPAVGGGKEKGIKDTLAAYDEAAVHIAKLAPETIIYITPHNVLYADYFHISPGKSAKGDFSRFGAPSARIEAEYDTELAAAIASIAAKKGIPAGSLGEKDAKLDHGYMVPAWFINRRYSDYKALRVSQSGMEPAEHYKLGQVIAEASQTLGRKTVLIASADLSHKLTHEGPYGYSPAGAKFDNEIKEILKNGDYLTYLTIPDELREDAAECGYNSIAVMAGAFDRRKVRTKLISYEGPFGVGYAVASAEPGEDDPVRDFLDQYISKSIARAQKSRESEDDYRTLARNSLEYAVENGGEMPVPDDISYELKGSKAGVFVSIHKNGRLRGCIGTLAPIAKSVAHEIIRNAVSAGLNDSRFEPVTASELPYLTYKVDVLSPPERIPGPQELDVKRYGVIVKSGYRQGVLLPNLDGIDTVEEQIAIARKKAGIPESAEVQLERFEVVRHE